MVVIRRYADQHYTTLFDTCSGVFARIEDRDFPEPQWAIHGPELMDISITNWCSRQCIFCYRKSDRSGIHMDVRDYQAVMRQASKLGVAQVALGGGNPNEHPDFCRILAITRAEHGIVPSYTTNGDGFTSSVLSTSRKYCGAVAVSAYPPFENLSNVVRTLIDQGIRTNVHLVVSYDTVELAMQWISDPPLWLQKANALVLLNLKPVFRATSSMRLAREHPRIGELIRLATTQTYPFKLGFDSCMVTGVLTHGSVNPLCIDGCDAARFSMFVSERLVAYPCSFMVQACEGHQIRHNNLGEIWREGALFVTMRSRLLNHTCRRCKVWGKCLGGCPLFPEMRICPAEASLPSSVESGER